MQPRPITVARGDGIGPEIVSAVLRILDASGARLAIEEIAVGKAAYEAGHSTGIPPEAWASLRRTGILLKGPITTPQGGGYKSLNVTLRMTLGLFANVRPVRSYWPFVVTAHPGMDLVIVRENEEDLYAGIEHRQTDEVYQSLKLVSRPGTERVVRYAFETARRRPRKKLTCMTKDNILKLTDGLFHKVFDEVAKEYPDVETDHYIIDIGMARVAAQPERFDVIVTLNLYGDILSDIAAEVSGSVGLAGSANIGDGFAMFEAVHGSAPDIAGKDIANPSGLLQAAVRMLVHIGQGEAAARVQNAWLRTLEDGIHTLDIWRESTSSQLVGTQAFAAALIERLGSEPRRLRPAQFSNTPMPTPVLQARPPQKKELVGIDVFLHHAGRDAEALGARLRDAGTSALRLEMITNRGVKVYPEGFPESFCTDHWRCRFAAPAGQVIGHDELLELLRRLREAGFDWIQTANLYRFDGQVAYSLGQGQ
ncbi:MAG: NADP-dependent isocitrate dehydrogenase [Planctomycetes bacterium]|nr:NADP-dependent isocitrate dehydrogenase [Planctomycetota bacterium]